jgi:hypothetical protein
MIRRSKMISFRLSHEEYQTLQEACMTQGVRSISDLARTAMQKLIAPNGHPGPLSGEVRDLQDKVRAISFELNRISKLVETRQAGGENRNHENAHENAL